MSFVAGQLWGSTDSSSGEWYTCEAHRGLVVVEIHCHLDLLDGDTEEPCCLGLYDGLVNFVKSKTLTLPAVTTFGPVSPSVKYTMKHWT